MHGIAGRIGLRPCGHATEAVRFGLAKIANRPEWGYIACNDATERVLRARREGRGGMRGLWGS